jgi:hypothetical protein
MDNYRLPDGQTYTAADDVQGVLYQRVKLATGADGAFDGDVSAGHPLPTTRLASAPVRRAPLQATAAGQTLVLNGTPGKGLRVLSLMLLTDTQVGLRFESGPAALSGLMPLPRGGGFVWPECEGGWLETSPGQPLQVFLDAAAQVGGVLTYQEV